MVQTPPLLTTSVLPGSKCDRKLQGNPSLPKPETPRKLLNGPAPYGKTAQRLCGLDAVNNTQEHPKCALLVFMGPALPHSKVVLAVDGALVIAGSPVLCRMGSVVHVPGSLVPGQEKP